MKDYRIKEIINANGSRFRIQAYSYWFGWTDAGHRMVSGDYIHLTFKEAKDHIQKIRDSKTTKIKYYNV